MPRRSEAYDFSFFEDIAAARKSAAAAPQQEPRREDRKASVIELPNSRVAAAQAEKPGPAHKRHAVAACLLALVLVGVLGTFVYGKVQLSQLAVDISAANRSLQEEQSLYTQLQMKNDAQLSLAKIEQAAAGRLGMQKIEGSQLETVDTHAGDKGEVVQASGNFFSDLWQRITAWLS